MTRIRKCRSKKRNPNGGGCGDPQCPEGPKTKVAVPREGALPPLPPKKSAPASPSSGALPRTGALPPLRPKENNRMEEALTNKNLDKFIQAKEAQRQAQAQAQKREEEAQRRANLETQIAAIDKTHLENFSTVEDMSMKLREMYPGVELALSDTDEKVNQEHGLREICVVSIMVEEPTLRNKGVGTHMRRTILKFADEHNYMVSGDPTTEGDGTIKQDQVSTEEWNAHCLAHRERLIEWYMRYGYEYNHLNSYAGKNDPLRNTPFPKDEEWGKQFNPEAVKVLRKAGAYVRWPNGEVPESWKA